MFKILKKIIKKILMKPNSKEVNNSDNFDKASTALTQENRDIIALLIHNFTTVFDHGFNEKELPRIFERVMIKMAWRGNLDIVKNIILKPLFKVEEDGNIFFSKLNFLGFPDIVSPIVEITESREDVIYVAPLYLYNCPMANLPDYRNFGMRREMDLKSPQRYQCFAAVILLICLKLRVGWHFCLQLLDSWLKDVPLERIPALYNFYLCDEKYDKVGMRNATTKNQSVNQFIRARIEEFKKLESIREGITKPLFSTGALDHKDIADSFGFALSVISGCAFAYLLKSKKSPFDMIGRAVAGAVTGVAAHLGKQAANKLSNPELNKLLKDTFDKKMGDKTMSGLCEMAAASHIDHNKYAFSLAEYNDTLVIKNVDADWATQF